MAVNQMERPEQTLCDRVEALLRLYPASSRRRIIIAMAGGPGSGKSTISAALVKLFNERNSEQIKVVPMDGFHYPKSKLSTLEHHECAFARRGAPFTFDSDSFIQLIHLLRENPVTQTDELSSGIWAPSFDHALKDPVENDIFIPSSQRLILLEGNYLLLKEKPWDQISRVVDETWFVNVSREIAKERIAKRHIAAGIENDYDAAVQRAENNDLKNLDLIMEKRSPPCIIVDNSASRDC